MESNIKRCFWLSDSTKYNIFHLMDICNKLLQYVRTIEAIKYLKLKNLLSQIFERYEILTETLLWRRNRVIFKAMYFLFYIYGSGIKPKE